MASSAAVPGETDPAGCVLLGWSTPWRWKTLAGGIAALAAVIALAMLLTRGTTWFGPATSLAGLSAALMAAAVAWTCRPRSFLIQEGGLRLGATFVEWDQVASFSVYPPDTVSLVVRHDVEVWGFDGDVIEFRLPRALHEQIESLLAAQVAQPRTEH